MQKSMEDNKSTIDRNIASTLASVSMEGYDFTEEQINFLTKLIYRVKLNEITWDSAIKIILKKFSKTP